MPFTFSHPALVLPLAYLPRRWVSLTGLVIGSLTPDFEYFLRMRIRSNYSHTADGLFWLDLPLGLLCAFIFHNIVRDPLLGNLPHFLKSRLSPLRPLDWNKHFRENGLAVAASILIGAASHILWDSFTHNHGFPAEMIPSLANRINLLGMRLPVFRILQHSSTIIGGLAIACAVYRLPQDSTATGGVSVKYWAMVAGITLGIVGIRLLSGLDFRQYGNVIATAISAGLISLTLTPLLMRVGRI
ncbi:MAG: DUF4184 family protein [Kiritimatiellaeota bacterium]|nr:DUF4184 family protein [Kiritimatiellota bacterium]